VLYIPGLKDGLSRAIRMTMETACTPRSFHVGLKALEELEKDGFICRGAKRPYKSGHSYPYSLTPQGEQYAA
jgi:hypothetical protein